MSKVLIFDEDAHTRNNFQTALENDGQDVLVESRLSDAMERLRRDQFEAVVMGLHFTHESAGIETLRRLIDVLVNGCSSDCSSASNAASSTSPAIVVATLQINENDRQEAFKLGAEAVLIKPVSPSEIAINVRDAITRHSRRLVKETLDDMRSTLGVKEKRREDRDSDRNNDRPGSENPKGVMALRLAITTIIFILCGACFGLWVMLAEEKSQAGQANQANQISGQTSHQDQIPINPHQKLLQAGFIVDKNGRFVFINPRIQGEK